MPYTRSRPVADKPALTPDTGSQISRIHAPAEAELQLRICWRRPNFYLKRQTISMTPKFFAWGAVSLIVLTIFPTMRCCIFPNRAIVPLVRA